MLRKMCMNVVFVCCMALLSAVGAINYPPLAGAQGVDSYTKLMLHADGTDQGTSFTDSETTPKTVTNTESYDSYTKLMLHIENNVTDSAAGKTVTNNNATFSSSVYKMGGYSGVFNGSNAYLSLADSDDWNFGTGDFTIDFWVRFNSFKNYNSLISIGFAANGYGVDMLYSNIDSQWIISLGDGVNTDSNFRPSWSPSTATWYHVALSRSGTSFRLFIDGTQIGNTYTNSYNIGLGTNGITIGKDYTTTRYLDGWLDEFRISKGIARWTSNFTPPSSPFGKVATVTSQKKFGTASGEFHGSGDYLSLANSNDWNFGTGDFTVDCWVKFSSVASTQYFFKQDSSWQFWWDSSLGLGWYDSVAGSQHSSWSPSINVWYHIAVTRSGPSLKLFVDGVQLGTTKTNSGDITGGAILYIGIHSNLTQPLNGYLDELRISKGIARWTSNFTPPSAPYETDTTPPTVSSTSPASSSTGVGVSGAISATFSEDMDSSTISTSTFTLTSSSGSSVVGTVSYSNKVATFTPSSNLSYATTYTATITTGVKDLSGNAMSSNYTWSFTTSTATATPTPTPSPGDTTAPTVTITSPTSSATYTTTSSTITLSGTASDNSGSVSSVTWSNSKGGSGTASGTTNWTISGISLSSGDNVITVTATDGSGNSGTDTITVTYNVTSTPTPTAVPTATTTPKPSPTAQPTPTRPPTLPPLPTPQPSPSPATNGIVFGFVNDQDEQPLEGVTVTIVGANGDSSSQETETDENGYYEFSGLLKGNYNLTYEKDGYQTQSRNISLGDGQQKDMGTITLENEGELGRIYGYVVDIKGNPIEGVKLALKGLQTKVKARETSDADGYFEFTGLGEDTYIITAKKKRYRNSKVTVELEEGEDKEEEIELRRTTKKNVHEVDFGMNGDVQK